MGWREPQNSKVPLEADGAGCYVAFVNCGDDSGDGGDLAAPVLKSVEDVFISVPCHLQSGEFDQCVWRFRGWGPTVCGGGVEEHSPGPVGEVVEAPGRLPVSRSVVGRLLQLACYRGEGGSKAVHGGVGCGREGGGCWGSAVADVLGVHLVRPFKDVRSLGHDEGRVAHEWAWFLGAGLGQAPKVLKEEGDLGGIADWGGGGFGRRRLFLVFLVIWPGSHLLFQGFVFLCLSRINVLISVVALLLIVILAIFPHDRIMALCHSQ